MCLRRRVNNSKTKSIEDILRDRKFFRFRIRVWDEFNNGATLPAEHSNQLMTVRRLSFDRNGTEDTKLGESVADTLLKSDEASRKRSCIFPIEFWQIDNLQEKISQRLRRRFRIVPAMQCHDRHHRFRGRRSVVKLKHQFVGHMGLTFGIRFHSDTARRSDSVENVPVNLSAHSHSPARACGHPHRPWT